MKLSPNGNGLRRKILSICWLSPNPHGNFGSQYFYLIGYKLRGIRGSIITALGTILPSFIIILAIALFFHSFKDNPIVERIFRESVRQW